MTEEELLYLHENIDKENSCVISTICMGVSENCVNDDSYGMICVRCNRCGRFNARKDEE